MSTNPFPGNPFFQVPPFADDPFDDVLNLECSVWKKVSVDNSYGQPVNTYELLQTVLMLQDGLWVPVSSDVPCLAWETSGKELNVPPAPSSETSVGVTTFLVLLRPIQVDTPPVNLNFHHFLQLKQPGAPNLDPNDKNSGVLMHDITNVENPLFLNHHFEAATTLILP